MILLDTGTPGTSGEIYSEDADGETRIRKHLKTCLQTCLAILTIHRDQALKRCITRLQQLKEKTYLYSLVLSIITIAEINA